MILLNIWYKTRESFWPIPFFMSLVSIALAFSFVWIDFLYISPMDIRKGLHPWLFFVDQEGARTLLSTIAGSTIGVAGVTFSITMVVLTLASSQFGPKLVRGFMKNLVNQITLGSFVSTFLYSLLVLKFIRTGESPFVPHLAVNFALVLTIVSLAVLIFFFHSVATQIQAESIINSVGDDFKSSIDRLFPKELKLEKVKNKSINLPADFEEKSVAVKIKKNGRIQSIDFERLLKLATKHDLIFKLNYRPGHYLHEHKSILHLYSSSDLQENIIDKIQKAITVGPRSMITQNIEFPINQLVEIAVRALSPGINDPFTAIQCIDALTSGLSTLSARPVPSNFDHDKNGHIRIVLNSFTFSGMLDSAFNQIRQNARSAVAVRIKLLESLSQIAEEAVRQKDKEQILHHGEMVYEGSKKEGNFEPADQKDILDRYKSLKRALNGNKVVDQNLCTNLHE